MVAALALALLVASGPSPDDVSLLEDIGEELAPFLTRNPDVQLLEDIADRWLPSEDDVALLEDLDDENDPLPELVVAPDSDLLEDI